MSTFNDLYELNVNDKTEKKGKLTYLSWAWAWAEVKKRYPDVTYSIYKDENGLPYVFDPNTGYMVYTTVTVDGSTHEMWLPVMDGNNRAMKAEPYKVFGKTVEAATMFDINKAIMRCLTKNLAVACGLGLYIYAGEDLPEASDGEDLPEASDGEEEKLAKAEEKRKKELLDGLDFQFIELAKLSGNTVDTVKDEIKKKYKMTGDFDSISADNLQKVFNRTVEWIKIARNRQNAESQAKSV